MRVLLQRVSEAKVVVDNQTVSQIDNGLLVLLGVEKEDTEEDGNWLCQKIAKMRLFPDCDGVMNRSIVDANGEFLVVSQFTLHASTKKGNRPSYIRSARPEIAEPLYELFLEQLWHTSSLPVKSGVFGADMKVHLVNDGPVTIWIDSRNRE
jgi:D-tyrosyl-tRNA(Tyr) deacylase